MDFIRLLQKWSYAGADYAIGTELEVDKATAGDLITKGVAEASTETSDDSDSTTVVKKVADTTTTSDATQTLNIDTIEKMLDAKLAPLAKGRNQRPPTIRIETKDMKEDDPRCGYNKGARGFGTFLGDVIRAGTTKNVSDNLKFCRGNDALLKAVGSDEYTTVEDALGGFLIPPEFSQEILTKGVEDDFFRSNGARQLTIGSTMVNINAVTDTTRASNSIYGGVQVYLQKERAAMTAASGEFEQIELKPKLLTGLYFITDNELAHVPMLGAFIGQQFQDAMIWKEMDLFMNGLGAQEPLGIVNAPCVYEQAKETGQAAATIATQNILKMRSRMRDGDYSNAVWISSLSCMEQLNLLTIDVGTGGAPIALTNIGQDGIARIMGRPLVFTEHAATIGTRGDLTLCSMPNYLIAETAYRSVDSSIHLRFDSNETAFRVVKTIDAQPWWRTTLTLANSWEVSMIVSLAARA